MLYHIGQKVIIRKDLSEDRRYYNVNGGYNDIANDSMVNLAGQVATIIAVVSNARYRIDLDNNRWSWTDGMFSGSADIGIDYTLSPFQRWEKELEKQHEATAV